MAFSMEMAFQPALHIYSLRYSTDFYGDNKKLPMYQALVFKIRILFTGP